MEYQLFVLYHPLHILRDALEAVGKRRASHLALLQQLAQRAPVEIDHPEMVIAALA